MENDERAELMARGIGLAKTHVYIAPGEDKEDPDVLIVSMADYFQGESFSITVNELEEDLQQGDEIDGEEGDESAGRIANSSAKICSKDTTYELPETRSARVSITYLDREQIIYITPESRSGWIEWTNV